MIRQLLTTALALLLTTGIAAQNEKKDSKEISLKTPPTASSSSEANKEKKAPVIRVTVPATLNIKDYVFVVNKSPYLIARMAVAVDEGDGNFTTIGSTAYLANGKTVELASYDDNKLKQLRGKDLLIKIKGYTTPSAADAFGGEDDDEDSRKVTYDFAVKLSEQNHDLYITVEGASVMDF